MKLRNVILNLFIFSGFFVGVYLLFTRGTVGSPPKVDPVLKEYVDLWIHDLNSTGITYQNGFNRVDSIVVSEHSNQETVGRFNKGNGCISISSREIGQRGPLQMRVLVYHELGHYVFNLEHCNSCIIMNPKLNSEKFYEDNWDIALTEYINQCVENEFEAKY